MKKHRANKQSMPTGRIPLALLQEPDITLDAVKAFAFMDYLRNSGQRGIDSADIAEMVGISEERLIQAAEYLTEKNWIGLGTKKPASIRRA